MLAIAQYCYTLLDLSIALACLILVLLYHTELQHFCDSEILLTNASKFLFHPVFPLLYVATSSTNYALLVPFSSLKPPTRITYGRFYFS